MESFSHITLKSRLSYTLDSFSFPSSTTTDKIMTALRVFPFIGAAVTVAAVVLAIIGVSTTYWFSSGIKHNGK